MTARSPPPSPALAGPSSPTRFSLLARRRAGSIQQRTPDPPIRADDATIPLHLARARSSSSPVTESRQSPPTTPVGESWTFSEAGHRVISRSASATTPSAPQILRLVPHLETISRSLHFEPVTRHLRPAADLLRLGRYNERSGADPGESDDGESRVTFRSKVVSRAHAEIWAEADGRVMIRDTKSSSGTFLNHIRLGAPGTDSRPFALRDGDVLQLGVDYQGGTEVMYRCVKMRVELNRSWQKGANAYNVTTFKQIQALGNANATKPLTRSRSAAPTSSVSTLQTRAELERPATSKTAGESNSTTCCICLFSVMVCQALFIAPCSHVYHYKCILPLLRLHHPGFSCPLCRTFADLDADVEIEEAWEIEDDSDDDANVEPTSSASTDGKVVPLDRKPSIASSQMSRADASTEAAGLDTRRSSFVVSGADGLAAPFPIVGRSSSRPASIRSLRPDGKLTFTPERRTFESAASVPGEVSQRDTT